MSNITKQRTVLKTDFMTFVICRNENRYGFPIRYVTVTLSSGKFKLQGKLQKTEITLLKYLRIRQGAWLV